MAANETAEAPGLIAVVGATGTGKSALSLALAERIARTGGRAEIVNADAMQLYRGMDIGTAKLTPAERRGIPHHLLDVLEVREAASVAGYQPRARAAVEDIAARGATPILVGGSGLYVSSVLYDFAFPPRDPAVRSRLEAEAETVGGVVLADRLAALDPDAAARIDPANTRRVIRALEILELGGAGHGGALPQAPIPWRPSRVIGLGMERAELTSRLDARVVGMWRDGLPEEAATLIPAGIEEGPTASRAIGYAQALAELRGEIGRDEAIAETQRLTRRYARRQVSWFRRDARVHWLEVRPGSRLPVEEAAVIAGLAPID